MKKGELLKNNIDTSADANIKGMGLQKLRLAERLLEALIDGDKCIYCLIEDLDDVVEYEQKENELEIRTEQNKNYKKPFTLNSEQVKNSLRIFFDNWRNVEFDESISFLFYTTNCIAKEKKVGVIKELNLKLPKEPLLELLIQEKYDIVLPIFIPVFKEYYIEQYKKHIKTEDSDEIDYYYKLLEGQKDEDWITFFKLIEWKFNCDNEGELKEKLLNNIEILCDRYDVDNKYSNRILDQIIGMIENHSMEKKYTDRIVHKSEIEVIFMTLAREVVVDDLIDPMHNKFDEIECSDYRNLSEKITYVCPEYNKFDLEDMRDEFVDGKYEQNHYPDKRIVKSYNYRLYKEFKKTIRKIIKHKETKFLTQEEIEIILDELTDIGEKLIVDKSKTYKMPYKDRDMIRKTIFILMEECFISFDGNGEKNG